MPMRLRLLFLVLLGSTLGAHVGSPDIFHEGEAGPYRLFVAIRPPLVIPGVAELEIRAPAGDVTRLRVSALPLTGPAAEHPPKPEILEPSAQDARSFTGSLWLMQSGSWQVRIWAEGGQGEGELAIPVPALATRTAGMSPGMAAVLAPLALFLVLGAISMAGAAVREAQLPPGEEPDDARVRAGRRAMWVTAAVLGGVLYLGHAWWNLEASAYDRYVYKPLTLEASLDGGTLRLALSDPGWLSLRQVDDLLPDHGHFMHLYVIRLPEMERVWHLHPAMTGPGEFEHRLPAMPAGRYQLYADIVHANGLAETPFTELEAPEAISGVPLEGDDAAGAGDPVSRADYDRTVFKLADGYRMVWLRETAPVRSKEVGTFVFRLEDAAGQPVEDAEFYMGMPGHAAFVAVDGQVFAHVHPTGSIPMAALEVARRQVEGEEPDPHAGHAMHAASAPMPPIASFPYALPQPGAYRIFVQMKRGGKVETGIFDYRVD
jgi:hypothetical protein